MLPQAWLNRNWKESVSNQNPDLCFCSSKPISMFLFYEILSLSLLKLRKGPGRPHPTDEKVFVIRTWIFKAFLSILCQNWTGGHHFSLLNIFQISFILAEVEDRTYIEGPTQLTEWGVVSTAILPHQTNPHSPPDGRQPYLAILPLLPCCLIIMQLMMQILILMMQILMMLMH